ncbi:hypothetical protein LCGC14_0344180, partial [marine sediment metagenome]
MMVVDHERVDVSCRAVPMRMAVRLRTLPAFMIVLVVLFTFSGLKCVEEHQQAVVLRFGRLRPHVRGPGLSWALPFPVDETLRVGVTAERLQFFEIHWLGLRPDEQGLALNRISRRGQGLNPAYDGALLTADKALAHVKWSLVYR